VARRIAEAHGGRILLESPPQRQPTQGRSFSGCCFTLELPAAP
jgi:signal transduction histidine kinase